MVFQMRTTKIHERAKVGITRAVVRTLPDAHTYLDSAASDDKLPRENSAIRPDGYFASFILGSESRSYRISARTF